jgi:uncharacterized protein
MAISLYDASVGNYEQTLGALCGILDRGLAHCRDNNIDPEEIVETRLFTDMAPFRFQIQSVVHHSIGTLEAFKSGTFSPSSDRTAHDYAALQTLVKETRDALRKLTPEDVNGHEGADVVFQFRDFKMLFTAENFLLSFSLPNFHFHATTAYDILRSKGVPLGKRDYMGTLRLKK